MSGELFGTLSLKKMKTMSKVKIPYSAPCLLLFGQLCEKTSSHFSDRQSTTTT